ncbi:MAG TPA: hypothetical protein VK686_05865 [Bryobacteraceae bacterium]|jgi:hypothetical protein|nr:hypothetical protein [Bryobacteraceae bacterium]
MAKVTVLSFAITTLVIALPAVYSAPITCTLATPTPPMVAANGESELVEDVFVTCVSTAPAQSVVMNLEVILNTNLTSRITNTVTMAMEPFLLIDDPKPGVANTSNGFPYFGQVLGTPGILAGASGSGNVYQGKQALSGGSVLENVVLFEGVPYVTGGTRTFRITNVRANAALLGINPVNAVVAITTDIAIDIVNPEITVANAITPLKFTSGPIAGAVGLDLSFSELFPTAFKKRIENTIGGPLTLKHQDEPGTAYCTESGFTPGFESLTAGAAGLADTGVRLLARLTGIPPGVTTLTVPNQVTSLGGSLVAHRVLPPFGAHFAKGAITTAPGDSTVSVSATHTAELLYDVTAAAPYLGETGCGVLDNFNITVIPSLPVSMTSTVVTGELAPLDSVAKASATAPEPRYIP